MTDYYDDDQQQGQQRQGQRDKQMEELTFFKQQLVNRVRNHPATNAEFAQRGVDIEDFAKGFNDPNPVVRQKTAEIFDAVHVDGGAARLAEITRLNKHEGVKDPDRLLRMTKRQKPSGPSKPQVDQGILTRIDEQRRQGRVNSDRAMQDIVDQFLPKDDPIWKV